MKELTGNDKVILDLIQQDLPLTPRPFAVLAESAGMVEADFIRNCQSLLRDGYIREISAIFNARGLGYKSTLVALDSDNPDDSARMINRHKGVSHNYYREHRFNLWFTLTIPQDEDFDSHIREMLPAEEHDRYRILESRRMFKIRVRFNHSELRKSETPPRKEAKKCSPEPSPLKVEEDLIRILQEPFPLVERPWEEIAGKLEKSETGILQEIQTLKDAEVIRRISGIIRHRKTGYSANGLACFKLKESEIERAGTIAAEFPEVSHCYSRTVYPDWPYPLMAMTHGRTAEECKSSIDQISEAVEAEETLILFSSKEYKKERVKYFL